MANHPHPVFVSQPPRPPTPLPARSPPRFHHQPPGRPNAAKPPTPPLPPLLPTPCTPSCRVLFSYPRVDCSTRPSRCIVHTSSHPPPVPSSRTPPPRRNAAKRPAPLQHRFHHQPPPAGLRPPSTNPQHQPLNPARPPHLCYHPCCTHPPTNRQQGRPAIAAKRPSPYPLRPAPPTSQQVDKPESRKAGKHPRPVVPLPTSPPRSHPAHPLVEVIALCNHCILQSPPTPPAALPASAPLPDLTHPLPTRSPCHPAALPPARSPSYPAGKPRNRRAPLTLQLSDFPTNRQAGKPTSRQVGTHHHPPAASSTPPPFTPHPTAAPPLSPRSPPLRRCLIVHSSSQQQTTPCCTRPPVTRLNPPHTLQHRFLSCDHPTAHQPHHRPRSPYPAGKPKTPLSLLPLLRSPARPPASSFTLHHTPPFSLPAG